MTLLEETLRLMGCRQADAATLRLAEEAQETLAELAAFRSTSLRLPLTCAGSRADFGVIAFESAGLARHLAGCVEGYLFAATLGAGVDRQMRRYESTDIPRAHALQAAAAALLEQRCDEAQARLEEGLSELFLTPRFSPGYGDLPLTMQKRLLQVLDANRRIGLSCTEGCMLTPTKSITAVIGIGKTPCGHDRKGCAACKKKDCTFRREAPCGF